MRIQQYIVTCYKYAVNLEDFSILQVLVKLQMCATHISKTLTSFVQSYFPSPSSSTKTTYEQKYVTEIIFALITCKPYNLIKEIFHKLCILLCNEFENEKVLAAKESIITLTELQLIMTPSYKFNYHYKYDVIQQSYIDELSEDDSVYSLNDSILKLPIYKGSPFYADLRFIFDDVVSAIDLQNSIDKKKKNSFYKTALLEDFMKQFGGILPLWTGITVPEGIQRYDNQPAERRMRVAKDLLDEMALKVGYSKKRPTRFVKLLREEITANAKRFRLKIRKRNC